jgi:NAD(P)H-hydrate repair Nnr-like enzyme with NAD(P)H-hydrate epimerase domain
LRTLRPGPLLVLAGSGDNGRDAKLAAEEAAGDGREVILDATPDDVAERAGRAAIVLDGLRGIGGDGAGLRGIARELALAVRPALALPGAPLVVAVDVPSGIDADTGAADDAVLPADLTVTFGAMKAGLLREPARTLAGRVILIDIGLALPTQEA